MTVPRVDVELQQQLAHARSIGVCVIGVLEEVVDFAIGGKNGVADRPIGAVKGFGASKEVFDVVRSDSDHGGLPVRVSDCYIWDLAKTLIFKLLFSIYYTGHAGPESYDSHH